MSDVEDRKVEAEAIPLGRGEGLSLPDDIQQKYGLRDGDTVTLIDLDSVLIITPSASEVSRLAAEIEEGRKEVGLSVDDLLDGLAEQRRRYTEEVYGDSKG